MRKFIVFLAALVYAGIISAPLMQVQAAVIQGNDLVCNGESFFQASNICSELSRLAREDGILAQGDNFKQIAISGAPIASILSFYKNCNPKPTYVVSDGAGIDLMSGNCSDVNCSKIQQCKNTLLQYLAEMKKSGTKRLLWMIYPDPQPPMGSATLKKNQDLWAEVVPEVMADIDTPRVLLVDLRPVWAGKYNSYTSDGIHCSAAGGKATAEAFWKAMTEDNFFDLTPVAPRNVATAVPSSAFRGQSVGNGHVKLSLSLNQPSNITLRLTNLSGRTILAAERQVSAAGLQTVEFPLGAVASGMYCCEVRMGQLTSQSRILVP
jgi:hypothetical protein